MILVKYYSKDNKHTETSNCNNESEAKLRAMSLNWSYEIISQNVSYVLGKDYKNEV